MTTVVTGEVGPVVLMSRENGEIAAFAGAASDFTAMSGVGLELRFITPDDMIGNPGGSAIVMREQIAERGDVLQRFFRAWAKGQHVGAAAPRSSRRSGGSSSPRTGKSRCGAGRHGRSHLPLDTQRRPVRRDPPLRWNTALSQLVNAGELAELIPGDDYLNDQFIAVANDFDRSDVEAVAQEWLEGNG